MKRLIAAILAVCTLFCLAGCENETYPPVESTSEESRTVLTLSYEDQRFEVPYELYRALFYTYRDEIDGGDHTRWQGEGSQALVAAIQDRIFSRIGEIYSVFAVCEKIGYDIYSSSVDEKIRECVKISVEGGILDGVEIEGYEGDYDAYLASLEAMHMNYSVQELLFRYMIAKNAISEHYAEDSNEVPEVTREELYTFYEREDTLRVLRLFLSADVFSEERVEEIALSLRELEGEEAVARAMIGYTTLAGPELENGAIITPYNLDSLSYAELTEAAFDLELYEVSAPVYSTNAGKGGYFILYRVQKSNAHFEECYTSIVAEYTEDKIGRAIDEVQLAFRTTLTLTDALKSLDHSNLK